MANVSEESALMSRLRALRDTRLPSAWVAEVLASTDGVPPGTGIDPTLWATYLYVVAHKHGQLKKDLDPGQSTRLLEALGQTMAHLDHQYPGLLDAPAAVAFALPAFGEGEKHVEVDELQNWGALDALELPNELENSAADTAWYGVSRLAASTMLLMGREGDAMPALQVRLYDPLGEEIFNRMLPFGDLLFVVAALLENLGSAMDLHHKALKQGAMSDRTRTQMETMIHGAEQQLIRLRRTLAAR
jgi:hypothetical protein